MRASPHSKAPVRTRTRPVNSAPQVSSGDYEVGYAKPPRHTRFKPGQSGNPKGRPKGSGDLLARVRAQLNKTMTMHIEGRRMRVTLLEAVTRVIVHQALNKDQRAAALLIKLLELVTKFDVAAAAELPTAGAARAEIGSEIQAFVEAELERLGLGEAGE